MFHFDCFLEFPYLVWLLALLEVKGNYSNITQNCCQNLKVNLCNRNCKVSANAKLIQPKTEAVVRSCSVKKIFLKIQQNSPGKSCFGVSS